jgi:hypothetical protein
VTSKQFCVQKTKRSTKVRSVEDNAHGKTTDGTGDGDGHDPREDKETNTLPVDSLDGTVAETDTDGGTSDAHGRRYRERVLREDEDGEGSTHFHGATTRRRVVGDLVTHDLHDVVAVGDETKRQSSGEDGQLPNRNGSLGLGGVTGVPGRVDNSPRTDSVTDIVGAVSERGSAGSENLDEGVGVLDLVGVLRSVGVDALHAATLRRTVDTSLGSVDIVVSTVESTDNDHGGNALESDDHVPLLIDLTSLDLVLVEVAHGPAKRAALGPEPGVEAVLTLLHELLVAELAVLVLLMNNGSLLVVGGCDVIRRAVRLLDLGLVGFVVVLDNSVVGNAGSLSTFGGGAAEEERPLEHVVPADGMISLDDLSVEVGDEDQQGDDSKTNTARDSDSSDIPRRLLVETEVGRSLVDDGQSTDGTSDQEEEGSSPDSPGNRVLAEVDGRLDEHEDYGTEAGGGSGSHSKTSEDSTKTLALIPSPLNVLCTGDGDTDTSDRGNKRVGGRDVSRVPCAPHDPDGSTSQSAGECKHLDTSIATEGRVGNNAVLDGISGTSTDSDGTDHLEDGTENHSLTVGDRTGRDRGSPSVGNIVWYDG